MLLYQLLRQFIKKEETNERQFIKKEETNECKTNKDLLTLRVSDAGMQIKLENINYGSKTKKLL